jgi:Predicted membrane protein (DUF2232)
MPISRNLLAGIAAGLVSFLALLSATSGNALIQFFLFVAAPLPIYFVGLALGWQTAAIATVAAGLGLSAVSGSLIGLLVGGAQFGPPVLLSYLALLNRGVPSADGRSVFVEWYPSGRLVLWCAVLGTMLSVLLLMLLGKDNAELQKNIESILRQTIQELSGKSGGETSIPDEDLAIMTKVALALLPAVSGTLFATILFVQFSLSHLVTKASGYAIRPSLELSSMTFPPGTPLILAGSVVLAMLLSGYGGIVASAASGAFYFAYMILGLAVIHYLTRNNPYKSLILLGVYLGLLAPLGFNVLVSLLLVIIGLVEPFSPLRRDFMRPPPSTGPPNPQ